MIRVNTISCSDCKVMLIVQLLGVHLASKTSVARLHKETLRVLLHQDGVYGNIIHDSNYILCIYTHCGCKCNSPLNSPK